MLASVWLLFRVRVENVDSAQNTECQILRLITIMSRKFIAPHKWRKMWELFIPVTWSFPAQLVHPLLIDIYIHVNRYRHPPRRHTASTDTQPEVTVIDNSSDSCDNTDGDNSEDSCRSRIT